MGILNFLKLKKIPQEVSPLTLSLQDEEEYTRLKKKLLKDKLTEYEWNYFSDLDFKMKQAETEIFKLGENDIFVDNDLSQNELIFFKEFTNLLVKNNINHHLIRLNRLGDETINVRYIDWQIGRIKLRGKVSRIQILKSNSDDVKWIENQSLETYMEISQSWITYLKYLLTDKY
jgi:hypothetical protein